MPNLVEKIIFDNFNFLKKDLQDDIIIECRGLLSTSEFIELDSFEDEEKKIEKFLNIMSKKSYSNLNIFLSKLEEWYSWLHEGIKDYIHTINPEDDLFNTHKLGGVPNLPLMNITREELLIELKRELRSLKKGHYLVIHGMVGSGKTSLAVEALLDNDILNLFGYQVYWLTAGSEGAEDPTILLEELNARLPDKLPHISSPTHLAAIELNKRFISKNWTESLIVLDDVTNESVLDCFAIAAKFLIITKDKGIISNKREPVSTFLRVNEGFTEAESQQLIAKALDINVTSLPHHASDIHKATKGHPFFLSMFASHVQENREAFRTLNGPWDYYITKIFSKERKRRWSMSQSEFFFKPIKKSVSSLDQLDQKFFSELAVFQEDVNIKPKVLATLWSVHEFEAVDIMQKFVQKSLAVKKWNELQKSYVYGVHDLIGDFLRKDLTPENEKKLHANLMEKYRQSCKGDWSKLPRDDNYIFYYIGYHLKKAGMGELFSQIIFDLEFLEAKLRVTGPADLLRDFNKYKALISNKEATTLEKIVDYCNFIEHFGVWINQGVSIIQAALQTSETSFIYNLAKKLVLEKHPGSCYLKCMMPSHEKPVPLTLVLKEPIMAVCFGKTITEAIIASGSGANLELYSFKTKSVTRRFSGHTGKINCLSLSSSKLKFLSASFDNTIRIWSLESSGSSSGERTPSPQERQESYINFFGTERTGEKAIATLNHNSSVVIGLFAKNDDSTIASLCMDGTIVFWRNYSKVWDQKLYEFKSIDFCSDDEYLAAASSTKILFLQSESGRVIKQFDSLSDSISLATVLGKQGEGLALLSKRTLAFYRMADSSNESYPMDIRVQSPFSKLCSIGPHIAVTTEDGSLFVLNSENGEQITYIQSQKKVVSFCVAERAIIAGYDDGKVFLYPLEALMSITLLKWSRNFEPVIAKMDSIQHIIEVCVGNNKTLEFEIDDIEKMDISEDGSEIVTVTKFGRVELHSVQSPSSFIIQRPSVPVSAFLLGRSEDLLLVLSYNSTSTEYQTLVWRENTDIIVLKTAAAVKFACLLDDVSGHRLITSPPFTIWDLAGQLLWKLDIEELHCINPRQKLIAASTVSGLVLRQFDTKELSEPKSIESTNHVDLLEFSPSGNKLALIESDGTIMVYDCNTKDWKYMPGHDALKKVVYLAVSDSGCICYGGNGLVCIVSPNKETCIAVVDVTCIIADPSGADIFAVADKSGHICKIYQDFCTNSSNHQS